LYSYCLLRSQ